MYDHSLDRVKDTVVFVRLRFPSETVGKNGFGNGVSWMRKLMDEKKGGAT
jgi:hypothetical protein